MAVLSDNGTGQPFKVGRYNVDRSTNILVRKQVDCFHYIYEMMTSNHGGWPMQSGDALIGAI
jgi:hypothetical protein